MTAPNAKGPALRSTISVVVAVSSFVAFLALLLGVASGVFTHPTNGQGAVDIEVRQIDAEELRRTIESRLGQAASITIALNELFPWDWDECHVLSPYSDAGERLRERGVVGWNRLSPIWVIGAMHDGVYLLAFVRDGTLREFASTQGTSIRFVNVDGERSADVPAARVTITRRTEEWGVVFEVAFPHPNPPAR